MLTTIDDVIATLESIVRESEDHQRTLGYFAALYLKVTREVKAGILAGDFEQGDRMEQLDIIFAKRYIDAYYLYQRGAPVSQSWQEAMILADDYWPIVLQHLLLGMNAHINLDLGIAAAEVMKGQDIELLKTDFDRINTILAGLVHQVQQELATIWPTLHWILRKTNRTNKFLTNFSMEVARDGAWKFAQTLAQSPPDQWPTAIKSRDAKVANKAIIITHPGRALSLALKVVRIGERGTVIQKIQTLNA